MSDITVADDIGLKVRDSSNILLLAPTPHPMEMNICTDLLSVLSPAETNAWCLSVTLTPEERLGHWKRRVGTVPARCRVLTPQEGSDVAPEEVPDGSRFEVVPLSDPGNLTKLGVEFTETLEEWEGTEGRPMVCIQSVTSLLEYTDFHNVFRFLHNLKSQVNAADAVAHYHMDPVAHDERTVAKVRQLFDSVVRITRDDTWHVMTREFEAEGQGSIPTLASFDRPATEPPE